MAGHKLVIKDALWQLFGRVVSALFGFAVTKIISSYLGPLRYGDYGTIFRFFAWWTALVDFGVYVIAVKKLGEIKNKIYGDALTIPKPSADSELAQTYGKFVGMRSFMIFVVYAVAIVVAYLIPAYTSNPFIIRGIPVAMLYSASNMFAGIQQLPLQIFWKMKRLTWSLIIARLSQLAVLIPVVFFFFKHIDFSDPTLVSTPAIIAFILVIGSVLASSIGQNIEIHLRTRDLLPLKIKFDFSFIGKLLKKNRKYGFSYFFSSFHTLLVLMFLGRFFPTSAGYSLTGMRALALSLIEILLIIPSALGNSLLHKIPNYSEDNKKRSLGNLLLLVGRIGTVIALNFRIFADNIIPIVSSKEFLGSWASVDLWGSNQILPFLGIVLVLSFIKQVYNYLFVALDHQNILFEINLFGLLIGVGAGLMLIPKYGVIGGIVVQLLMEVMFTGGAIAIGCKKHLTPIISKELLSHLLGSVLLFAIIGVLIKVSPFVQDMSIWMFFLVAFLFNILLCLMNLKPLKRVAKGLTND